MSTGYGPPFVSQCSFVKKVTKTRKAAPSGEPAKQFKPTAVLHALRQRSSRASSPLPTTTRHSRRLQVRYDA